MILPFALNLLLKNIDKSAANFLSDHQNNFASSTSLDKFFSLSEPNSIHTHFGLHIPLVVFRTSSPLNVMQFKLQQNPTIIAA